MHMGNNMYRRKRNGRIDNVILSISYIGGIKYLDTGVNGQAEYGVRPVIIINFNFLKNK